MSLMRKTLFRALPAAPRQQLRCMDLRMDSASKLGDPGNVSENDRCRTAKCSTNPFITEFPARDLTLYKPSDMLKRTYQCTWCEFQPQQRKDKAACKSCRITYEDRIRPKGKGRVKPGKWPKSGLNLGLGKCHPRDSTPCPRFKLPFCKDSGMTGCFPVTRPSGRIRPRTKYPSFSECLKDPLLQKQLLH